MSSLRRRLLFALIFLDLAILYLARFDPKGRVHLWILPRAAGLFILLPNAETLLFDGHMDAADLAEIVGSHVPPLWGRLRLAVITREDESVFDAQAQLFRHLAPAEAWRVSEHRAHSAAIAWEDRVRGSVRPLAKGLTLNIEHVQVRVAAAAPPAVIATIGRMQIVYAPEARWEQTFPDFASSAFMWLVGDLQAEDSTPLPPVVILPHLSASHFTALAPTVLRHRQTTFFIGEERTIHITTDGERYTLELLP